MKVIEMERIVKKYYDALEEGKVLGRKCTACGHIEYPPYLACNECGNLDTEWVDLTNVRAHVKQIIPPLQVFPETEWKNQNGGYIPIAVSIDGADAYDTSLVHVDADRYDELHDNLENVIVKPYIVQGEDTKVVAWVLEDYEDSPEELARQAQLAKNADTASDDKDSSQTAGVGAMSEEVSKIAATVIDCAAAGYEVDASSITLATDIREDLSNQSMKMIVMISEIEERLGVTIDIPDAGNLNTLADFTNKVLELKGMSERVAADGAMSAGTSSSSASSTAASSPADDELTKTVIECAAAGYEVDASTITPQTDIREDLSNQSMKMIVMISEIEERLGVTIDIPDAGNLNTIADFVQKVKELQNK
ncbi:MAG: acyl carrier protein [Lachnospiraceae bacterium]|nr:acyl carrier protein [Lachnospiraceae bacterium]